MKLSDTLKGKGWIAKISFIFIGIISTVWFLIRVIPKPSRATYPCMKAAAPVASSFVAYLLGITSVAFFLKRAGERFRQSKYVLAFSFIFIGLIAGIWSIYHVDYATKAATTDLAPVQAGNEPIGTAKGIFPGRVVWVRDVDATNASLSNQENDYWSSDGNANQSVISLMLSQGLISMTGASNDADAWDSIFYYYNRTHGKGNKGYSNGQKIVIKTNFNGIYNSYTSEIPKNINTSPQICYAILNQLVNKAGVPQSAISIGDPNCDMDDVTFNKCFASFPNVTYWGSGTGRIKTVPTVSNVIFSSTSDPDLKFENQLPKAYIDAAYMINIPVFKKHHRAGISLCSKNHFGSLAASAGGAYHLHPSLPCPNATGLAENGNYGVYRCFVDIMGHKDLGGKTILYLIDGIWGSTNWGHPPVKWRMAPFNNDYPSSLFMSQDPVAIESVGFDFLYHEFDSLHPSEGEFIGDDKGPFARFPGTDDFLHQAADTNNWPFGISYDPEKDGSILSSLGVHEHWNNASSKQYSRNLNPETGKGIELYKVGDTSPIDEITLKNMLSVYPNPAVDFINIALSNIQTGNFEIIISGLDGKVLFKSKSIIRNNCLNETIPLTNFKNGTYIITVNYNNNTFSQLFVKHKSSI